MVTQATRANPSTRALTLDRQEELMFERQDGARLVGRLESQRSQDDVR